MCIHIKILDWVFVGALARGNVSQDWIDIYRTTTNIYRTILMHDDQPVNAASNRVAKAFEESPPDAWDSRVWRDQIGHSKNK